MDKPLDILEQLNVIKSLMGADATLYSHGQSFVDKVGLVKKKTA